MLENVTIPNGISWSLDDRVFYFTDSAARTVFAYDYDSLTGSITNRRPFFEVPEEDGGTPDGHAQDIEGNLWVAIWGGWKVVRVNWQGQVTAAVRIPTRCVTVRRIDLAHSRLPLENFVSKMWYICVGTSTNKYTSKAVAFAGQDIYITSEADPKPAKYPESVRYHGAVFKATVGIRGRAPNVARIEIGGLLDSDE